MMSMNVAACRPPDRDGRRAGQPRDAPRERRRVGRALARAVTDVFGGSAAMADYVMPAHQARGAVIEGSVTKALRTWSRRDRLRPPGRRAYRGSRGDQAGRGQGRRRPAKDRRRLRARQRRRRGIGADASRLLRIEIQNENLVVLEDGEVLASVPDLITVVDSQTADAVATELFATANASPSSRSPAIRSGARERGLADRRPDGVRLRLRLRPGGGAPWPRL